ncbi:MAG: AraC family transcriptional regulator [Paludibacter sp.]|nr:AraC family transcriptional regulator [Paludibacter sp.]
MNINDLQSEFRNDPILNHFEDFGLTVNSVGYKVITPNKKIATGNRSRNYKFYFKRGKITDEFKIVYITNGTGYVQFQDRPEMEIGQGKALIIRPNQVYEYYHVNDTEWKEYFIRFEADEIYFKLLNELFNDNNQVIEVGFNEEMIRLFTRAVDIVRNGLKSSQVYLSGLLLHILGLITFESNNSAINRKDLYLIEKSKIIMNEDLLEDIQLTDIARQLNISYTTFRINFKKYVGVGPAKYLNELRLNKSQQLLQETTHSIKEIAYMLQFSSIEHFSTIFKKQFGMTPKEFRTM